MHPALSKLLYLSAARTRNPSLEEEYERIKGSEWLSRAGLEALQLERAVRFLRFAGRHSPHYRRVFQEHGFVPERMSSVEDLKRIPTIAKSELIDRNREIHVEHEFPKVFVAETSGTTGRALEFRKNERWDSINRAYVMRAYDWYGVKPWERNGYLWGYDIAPKQARKVRTLDALQNRFRIFSYDRASVRRFAEQLQGASYVGGYSSMIYEAAKIINELGLPKPQLKMVKGTSEMILDIYQAEAEKAFGRRIVSEYGAAESGLIAFECPSGRMHVNMEDVIVEVGASGEVIVTNLASYSFPIIRYVLGDSVTLSDEACACGRSHQVVAEVLGRRGASVVGATGRYPALTFYYVFKNLAIQKGVLLNYKAVQEEPAAVVIQIEGRDNQAREPLVREQLDKYFGADVTFAIRFVDAFERAGKKSQYFESRLT